MNDKCTFCKNKAVHKHHVCYYPELVVAVCNKCHRDIHRNKENIYNPGKGASKGFYKQLINSKTITIDEVAWKELRNWQTDNGGTFSSCIIDLVKSKRRDLE